MTNFERLVAALVALSLAGDAAAQGGPLTPLDDPRLQPVHVASVSGSRRSDSVLTTS